MTISAKTKLLDHLLEMFIIVSLFRTRATKIEVNPEQALAQITESLKQNDVVLFHGAQFLDKSTTFVSHGITEYDVIFVFNADNRWNEIDRWLTMTDIKKKECEDRMRILADPKLRRTVLRQLDAVMLKVESKPRAYRTFVHTFIQNNRPASSQPHQTILTYESKISEDPLPVPWEQ